MPDPQAWHEDVRLFRVHDDTAEGPVVGEFYLDMHPREGVMQWEGAMGLIGDVAAQTPVVYM